MLIVGAAGEEVLLGLHFSMGTVWADTALFGQPVLAISARLYTQSLSLSLSLLHGYSMGRYGSLWAASAGDICPSLYSESLSLSLSSPWAQYGQIRLSLGSQCWRYLPVSILRVSLSLSLFSMGTVRADTALFGQPVLAISARLYTQSLSLSLSLLHGYSTGRYGSLWAASAGDICPSLYSESLSLSLSSPWVQYGQIRLSLGSQCWRYLPVSILRVSLSLSLFSMGTVRADTALFGQPVLAISARLYTQSIVAQNHWTIELLFYYWTIPVQPQLN